jgi:hypothetical protein
MLSRRRLLKSLAASAAGALSPLPAWSIPDQPVGSPANRAQIVDFDFDATPYLAQLRNAGVRTIGRYYDRAYGTGIGEVCYHHKSKTLTKAELTAIERAGMFVYVIYQHCNHSCANFDMANPATADKGRKDAIAAVELARDLGQPAGTPIYFGVDFDPYPGKDCAVPAARIWPSVEQYFNQINEVFAQTGWQVGVYGAGVTCKRLKESGGAKFFWLSTSLGHSGSPEFFNSGEWHLFQNVTEVKRPYAPDTIDTDVANPAQPYFGAWTSHGPAPKHDPEVARAILDSRVFIKKGCVIQIAPNPKSRTAMRTTFSTTCRLMTAEERGYFGVSLTEDEEIDGYVHIADIITGGLTGNMPKWAPAGSCTTSMQTVARPSKPISVEALASPPQRYGPAGAD